MKCFRKFFALPDFFLSTHTNRKGRAATSFAPVFKRLDLILLFRIQAVFLDAISPRNVAEARRADVSRS